MQTIGYYSLIQYCPNPLRLESVNIGLVLFVPEAQFLQTRVNTNSDRVRKFFGRESFNNDWLIAAKKSIKQRVKIIGSNLQTAEDFKKFTDTRINEILLTPPKPVKIDDPEKKLDALYEELVAYQRKRQDTAPIIKELDEAFKKTEFKGLIEFEVPVVIPHLNRKIIAAYAYRNGIYNLIKPELFTDTKKTIERGSLLATEGRFIKKLEARTELIIVPELQYQDAEKRNSMSISLRKIFEDAQVRAIWPNERKKFIEEVKDQAHLPNSSPSCTS